MSSSFTEKKKGLYRSSSKVLADNQCHVVVKLKLAVELSINNACIFLCFSFINT